MTDDDQLLKAVKADLRRLVESTSPRTRARLDQLVDVALRERVKQRRSVRQVAWPIGAVAASTAAVMLALHAWREDLAPATSMAASASAADDVALLLNVDDLDLLERMEFYRWVEQQPGMLEGERSRGAGESPLSPR